MAIFVYFLHTNKDSRHTNIGWYTDRQTDSSYVSRGGLCSLKPFFHRHRKDILANAVDGKEDLIIQSALPPSTQSDRNTSWFSSTFLRSL